MLRRFLGSVLVLLAFVPPAAAMPCGTEAALPAGAVPRSPGPPHGALLLVGGGDIPADIQAEAARLAGGPSARWVVIPTASDDQDIPKLRVENAITPLGQRQTMLHTRDRREADTDDFIAPLRDATAVWFEGGRQTRIVDAYAGTRTERELRALLDRGGLIAGTSAGATIQGSRLVRGGGRGSILTAPQYRDAFGYVANLAVDQHVDARHRDTDLMTLVAASPGLLGLGLDEATALVIRGNVARVIGAGRVLVTDGADHGAAPFWCLRAGDRLDLATWARMPP